MSSRGLGLRLWAIPVDNQWAAFGTCDLSLHFIAVNLWAKMGSTPFVGIDLYSVAMGRFRSAVVGHLQYLGIHHIPLGFSCVRVTLPKALIHFQPAIYGRRRGKRVGFTDIA